MMPGEEGLSAAALRIASYGWPVLPCQPHAKVPLTMHGLHDATTDPDVVVRWWRRCPRANVGLRTGACSGIIVIDTDGEEGYESLRELERSYSPLPRTASVKTPRGGEHYYLRHPGGHVANSAALLGAGIDVRGDGGYVLAPPSIGANGNVYEVDERAPVAPAPAWLCRLLDSLRPRRAPTPTRTWVKMIRHGLTDGERNDNLTRLVGHLLARDVDARVVRELALLVNTRGRPPLPDREVDRIVDSIAGREERRRRGLVAT